MKASGGGSESTAQSVPRELGRMQAAPASKSRAIKHRLLGRHASGGRFECADYRATWLRPSFRRGRDSRFLIRRLKHLDFAPVTRVAYNINEKWAAAAEEYDDFGPLQQFHAASERAHQLYAVVDRGGRAFDIEFGIGFGLTASSDRLTLKLLVAKDLGHIGRTQ